MPPTFSRERKDTVIFHARLQYQMRTSPCERNCPAGNAIQRVHNLVQDERFAEALRSLRASNPFSGVTGRVCHHPCEANCNRAQFDEAVSIKALERAASDYGGDFRIEGHIERTGKRIAVVGSGPCGLSCAYYLGLLGHEVTVFEALPFLGGIPRAAIPDYHLPKEVVNKEVARILELGVKVRMNTKVGKDVSFEEITTSHDACLIAAGAWHSRMLNIPGGELAMPGMEFLTRANRERPSAPSSVVVVGGGGVGVDCARTAARLGATNVYVVCLEAEGQMLACPEDIEQAKREGIVMHNSQTLTRILNEDGRVTGVECQDVRSFQFDEDGQPTIVPVAGSERILTAGLVITAVGEVPDVEPWRGINGFTFTRRGTLEIDPVTFSTGKPRVFAAGDIVTGPSSVAQAVGGGRQAAIAIDSYVRGQRIEEARGVCVGSEGNNFKWPRSVADGNEAAPHVVTYEELTNLGYFEKKERVPRKSVLLAHPARISEELDRGYLREQAKEEASRCFHCGHCFVCGMCVDVCPGDVLAMINDEPQVVYPEECIHCGACMVDCPASAIHYRIPLPLTLVTYPSVIVQEDVPDKACSRNRE